MPNQTLTFLAMLLVTSSVCQFAIGQSNNCCADMPGIIDGIMAKAAEQQNELDTQLLRIENLEAQLTKKSGPDCERTPDGCYKVMLVNQYWKQARPVCEALGGHLVFLESEREHNTVVGLIKSAIAKEPVKAQVCESNWLWKAGKLFHIGARRTLDSCSARFVWKGPAEKQKELAYTNWQKNEPGCTSKKEYCSQVVEGYNYQWNDIYCDDVQIYGKACSVCEFDL